MDVLDEVWVKVKFNIESEMLMEFFGNVGGGEALRGYRKDQRTSQGFGKRILYFNSLMAM